MRVAHLSPTYFAPGSVVGGGERYVFNLASALAAADPAQRFQQTIFALGAAEDFFVHDGIPVRVLKNENPSPNAMDGISTSLWREVEPYDLLHVHQCLTVFGVHACALARSLGKMLVVTDLGGGDNGNMTRGRGLALADGAVSISQYAHSLIAGDFGGPYEVMIGPVDTGAFVAPERAYGGPPRVLCVSRILPHKGIDRVIGALPEEVELRIVGQVYDGEYHAFLQELATGKRVTFVHDADDRRLRELYHEATVFAQASTAVDYRGRMFAKPELMGLSPLEAMASGLPAIVSNVASLPELASDPAICRVFGGEEALAAALRDVAAGVWPLPGAGARARQHVVTQYGYAAVGARLAAFYRHIASARHELAA